MIARHKKPEPSRLSIEEQLTVRRAELIEWSERFLAEWRRSDRWWIEKQLIKFERYLRTGRHPIFDLDDEDAAKLAERIAQLDTEGRQ